MICCDNNSLSLKDTMMSPFFVITAIILTVILFTQMIKRLKKIVKLYISLESQICNMNFKHDIKLNTARRFLKMPYFTAAMEDQVPFKVYTYWEGEGCKPEVRRFGVDKTVVSNYNYLQAKIHETFPLLKEKTYNITWQDEDGDYVAMSTDDEVMTMLSALRDSVVKLHVYCNGAKPKEEFHADADVDVEITLDPIIAAASSSGISAHFGVSCDGCGCQVVGFRYKCITCDNYDLCSRCEAARKHPEHCVVRMPAPTMPLPLIKASIKKSRQFLKSVATMVSEENKKHKRERSSERKRSGHTHGGKCGREERHRDRNLRSCTWMDIVNKYMDEFANLAGDFTRVADPSGGSTTETKTAEAQTAEAQTSEAQPSVAQPSEAQPSGAQSSQPEQNDPTISLVKILRNPHNLPKDEAMKMIRALKVLHKNDESHISMILKAMQESDEAGQGDNKAPENVAPTASGFGKSDLNSQKSEAKSVPSSNASVASDSGVTRDGTPDKADDWTMINKVKDSADLAEADNIPSAPSAAAIESLREELQERVRVSQLYPPLHTATAVLDPKEPEILKPVQATETPKREEIPATPQATAGTSKVRHHAIPHIDAAVQQMIAMGFTNEGGWLTQLLESKNGNIASVLDLLTPVNPKK